MRRHRHHVLPDRTLRPKHPVSDVSIEGQAEEMRRLRDAHNRIAHSYRERDRIMVALALSNSLSRQDMAIATDLAKSRVDQIIRDTHALDQNASARAAAERVARHRP